MRTILNPDDIHATIKDEVANFQSDIVLEVSKTVAENRVVIVGMKYNLWCLTSAPMGPNRLI